MIPFRNHSVGSHPTYNIFTQLNEFDKLVAEKVALLLKAGVS